MITVPYSVWIGFDPRESAAFAVARESVKSTMAFKGVPIRGVVLSDLKKRGLYTRPTEMRLGKLWDTISGAHMSTEFAISRFLVPHLAGKGWAVFMDCDVLVRADLVRLLEKLSFQKAVYCVKHNYAPTPMNKMDGQIQYPYPRKNWSSFMAFQCDHPSNKKLTVEMVNTLPGRDLHRFCWLEDEEIGELSPEWNWLVGEQPQPEDPKIVHWTLGGPWLPYFENVPFADEWRHVHEARWAA